MKPCIVITGGGTGGHVFPALAVAEILQQDAQFRLVWIGGSHGMEKEIVARWGMEFHGIPTGKLRRYFSLKNVWDLFKIAAGIVASMALMSSLKPRLVFSKGGFVSVPPVLAAGLRKIPVISHESDFDPGLATRINSRYSKYVCVAYPESLKFYAPGKAVRTGNPVRAEMSRGDAGTGRKVLGFSAADRVSAKPILLVQGGSLGARQVNEIVADSLEFLLSRFRVVHQRGAGEWDIADIPGSYVSRPFFTEEYPHVLAAADLVLSRSGAGSVWEIGLAAKPAVFVPLSSGARGDQVRNARYCEEHGCAAVFQPEDFPRSEQKSEFEKLMRELDDTRMRTMGGKWTEVVTSDGAARIADLITRTIAQSDAGARE